LKFEIQAYVDATDNKNSHTATSTQPAS